MAFQRGSLCISRFAKNVVRNLFTSRLPSSNEMRGVHLFKAEDTLGISAKITDTVAQNGGNMVSSDLFIDFDAEPRLYLSRSEFSFDPKQWPRERMERDFARLDQTFNSFVNKVFVPENDPRPKMGILVSKQHHCIMEILLRWQQDELPVDISCIVSNHPIPEDSTLGRALTRNGIPFFHVPALGEHTQGCLRPNEEKILQAVRDTDFLVLARFMQILSGTFLSMYGKEVINIHHGLLPSFKGKNPFQQAYDAGVKLIGATSHIVTEELDSGPIIEQLVDRVSHRDFPRSFRERSQSIEKQCLILSLQYYLEARLMRLSKNRVAVLKG